MLVLLPAFFACSGPSKNAKSGPPPAAQAKPNPNPNPGPPQTEQAAQNAQALSDRSVQLATKLSSEMNSMEKKLRVSVLPFTDNDGRVCPLGKYVSDKIVTGLPRSEHYALVERARLDQVMKELKLESSSMISDETVASLGNMLGADALIIGTFTDLGASIDVNCRIIEPETGLIIATANTQFLRGPAVDKLWSPPALTPQPGAQPPAQQNNSGDRSLQSIPLENNTNRPGKDFRHFPIDDGRPRACLRACGEEPRCKAFTFVKPGVQGPKGQCWLKDGQAKPILQPGMISGVKTEAVSSAVQGKVAGTDPQNFPRPVVDGHPLALCIAPKQGCGINAASAWCQKRGFDRATHFTVDPDVGELKNPPKRVGDGGLCRKAGCDAISSVICTH